MVNTEPSNGLLNLFPESHPVPSCVLSSSLWTRPHWLQQTSAAFFLRVLHVKHYYFAVWICIFPCVTGIVSYDLTSGSDYALELASVGSGQKSLALGSPSGHLFSLCWLPAAAFTGTATVRLTGCPAPEFIFANIVNGLFESNSPGSH